MSDSKKSIFTKYCHLISGTIKFYLHLMDSLFTVSSLEQGAYQNSIEVAKKLIKMKLTIEQVIDVTKLPIEVVEQLQKELAQKIDTSN